MAIQKGDRIPSVTLKQLGDNGLEEIRTDEFFKGKRVALFSVPGAFTPTCSATHLPGFVEKAGDLKSKGVDEIACLAVNDPFVMKAWGDQHGVDGKVTMLPDGNGELTRALGMEMDGSGAGLGTRGKRFSLIANDGVVESVHVEEKPSEVTVTGPDTCLADLG